MEGLICRLAALEEQVASSAAIAKDFRVIAMHLARAEEKLVRLSRSSCVEPGLDTFVVEDL